jgi:hypothetical protein
MATVVYPEGSLSYESSMHGDSAGIATVAGERHCVEMDVGLGSYPDSCSILYD